MNKIYTLFFSIFLSNCICASLLSSDTGTGNNQQELIKIAHEEGFKRGYQARKHSVEERLLYIQQQADISRIRTQSYNQGVNDTLATETKFAESAERILANQVSPVVGGIAVGVAIASLHCTIS